MRNLGVFAMLVMVFFYQCDKPVPKPDNLIGRDDFVDIMTETYLYRNLKLKNIHSGNINYAKEEAYILQSKGVDWETFKASYTYYMTDERSNKKIMADVKKRLEMMISESEMDLETDGNIDDAESVEKP